MDIPILERTNIERNQPLRVCYFGTYRQEYSRNQIMIEGLRRAGVEVVECHESLWRGVEDRVQAASGKWIRPEFLRRFFHTYWTLLKKYRKIGDYDILVAGYPGQMDVFMARLLTWLRHKPLVWDIFMSIYLISLERGLEKESRLTTSLLRCLEWAACRLPDQLIIDTSEYVVWFRKTHGVSVRRFQLVPTGADERIFHPVASQISADTTFRVIYYGTFIRNHGVEIIIEAARLLAADQSIQFEFIGDGPEREKTQDLAVQYGLDNVTFIKWLEKTELVERAARADVCLGAFGETPQSLMTIQNKIYEGMAMAKPVITGNSPAIRQALRHGENIYLCERQNPQSLAEAIQRLKADPILCKQLGENGYKLFHEKYDILHNGQTFALILRNLIGHPG
jgi:glycosyltransferase involved in cell wall biosynthesis